MKYFILLCILVFALPAFSQQDSIVYSKGVRLNKDSVWFKETFTKIGDSIVYSKVPWTPIDSLVLNTLVNERHDAANQYRQAKLAWEEQERSYLMRLRQPTKQLNDLFKKSPDAGDHLRGKKIIVYQKKKEAGIYVPQIKVVGGVSRLYFTTTPGIGGTDPSDQSTLSIDDSTWSSHGTTFEFTCLKIDNTPSYRWVLKQR